MMAGGIVLVAFIPMGQQIKPFGILVIRLAHKAQAVAISVFCNRAIGGYQQMLFIVVGIYSLSDQKMAQRQVMIAGNNDSR